MRLPFRAVGALCLFWTIPVHAALLGVSYQSGDLYNVSTATGALTFIGNTGLTKVAALEYAADGTLYAFTADTASTLFTIDPDTAAATPVGSLGRFTFEGGLAFSTAGTAYGLGGNAAPVPQLFTMNVATGATAIAVTLNGGSHDVNGLAWRSDGMLIGLDRSTSSLLVIDPASGATSTLAPVTAAIGTVGGMAAVGDTGYFATAGAVAGVPGSNELYQFDLFTGAQTLIGAMSPAFTDAGIGGLAWQVPEPATAASLLLAAAILALPRRTRVRRV
jgi:hypothetical protein